MNEEDFVQKQFVDGMIRCARGEEANGGSVKMFLKQFADLPQGDAILDQLSVEEKQWLLRTIRSTRIKNRRQSERLEEIAETIDTSLQ